MSNSALTVLVSLLAVVSVGALVLAALAYRELHHRKHPSPLPTDLAGLRESVEALRSEAEGSLKHVGVVRYDAFGDMGGRLSWSLALVNERGNGFVLSSITGRSDSRTYAKGVSAWAGEQTLSAEEDEAIQIAKSSD